LLKFVKHASEGVCKSPVLNIDRIGRDIGRYLIFLLPIWYGKIIRPYCLQQKNNRYLKYRPINRLVLVGANWLIWIYF